MRRRHRYERKRRRLLKRKVLWNRQHIAKRNSQKFRITAVHLGTDQPIRETHIVPPCQTLIAFPATDSGGDKDALPHCDAINLASDLLHDPSCIRSRHMRKRNGIGRIALSYPDVEVIQRTGFNANQHILRTDLRLRQILIQQFLRSTMLTKQYRLHTTSFLPLNDSSLKSLLIPAGCSRSLSARPQRVKARGVPLRYVEGLNDARTTLAGFFNILPKN